MKKKLIIALGLTGIIALSVSIGAYAANPIKLFINGKAIATDVQIVKGSSYVPLKVVSESLGAEVKWDGVARTITITSGTPTATPIPVNPPKSFDVNVNVESGPMKLSISKVTFDPAYKKAEYYPVKKVVIFDVTVENTSADTVGWNVTSGTIVLNTKEQVNADSFSSDSVGGEFIGKVIKKGKIAFEVTSNFDEVNSINFKLDGAFNMKDYTRVGEDKTTEILLN
jgi:hypothetical protein